MRRCAAPYAMAAVRCRAGTHLNEWDGDVLRGAVITALEVFFEGRSRRVRAPRG